MATRYELTWEPATGRWKKIYRGKSYTVGCKSLGCPATKGASYARALAWWIDRHAAIDGSTTPPSADLFDSSRRTPQLFRQVAEYAAHQGLGEVAALAKGEQFAPRYPPRIDPSPAKLNATSNLRGSGRTPARSPTPR